jgi:agarase
MTPVRDALHNFRTDTVQGSRGFFRVGQTDSGQWWFIGPDDLPFFVRAVNGVSPTESPFDPVAQLRTWRFNALGPGAAPSLLAEGLPFVATVNFSTAAPLIRAKGIKLPDVFDPSFADAAQQRAGEVCSAFSERTDVLGWLTDDDLGWGGTRGADCPSLLQVCLSLEPSFAAFHAAWEFVLAPYGGQIARLAKAWGCPLENRGVIRELTRADRGLMTSGHLRDDVRWTREFAHRYFAITSSAVRAHDPHHLILGARDALSSHGRSSGSSWLSECVFPSVDLAWIHPQDLKNAPPGPLLVGNFSWAGEQSPAPSRYRARGVTSVERMLKNGRASLRSIIAHPAVVGYSWDTWRDDPGEQPPFARGLVHHNDVEAREHTELLSDLNSRIGALRPFRAGSQD